jgi:hypothetical protein
MNSVESALEDIYQALQTVPGVRLYRGVGVVLDPPSVVVGPPELRRELMSADPSTALFQVAVVVTENSDAMANLLRLEPLVAAAVDGLRPRVAVGVSKPGRWPSGGGQELPAYLIDVDYSL